MEHETRKKKRKKKSNQWSILKDRERNCLCPSFLPCQSSVDSWMNGVFALRSAKNRTSSTCASIVSSKRAKFTARFATKMVSASSVKCFEFFWARSWQILWLLEFFVRYVALSKDSPRLIDEESSNRDMHTYTHTHIEHIYIYIQTRIRVWISVSDVLQGI